MKYCSIDIETTGLDSENDQILSVAIIIEDTELKLSFDEIPKFNTIIVPHRISGSPRALRMNSEIINLIDEYLNADMAGKFELTKSSGYLFLDKDIISKEIFMFLYNNGFRKTEKDILVERQLGKFTQPIIIDSQSYRVPLTINVAGKNFASFDKLFLEKLPRWKQLFQIKQRIIDPASLYCDWKNDESLPSLSECKKRANISDIVSHKALEDAWDVIQVLREKY